MEGEDSEMNPFAIENLGDDGYESEISAMPSRGAGEGGNPEERYERRKVEMKEAARNKAFEKVSNLDKYKLTDRNVAKLRKRMDARVSKEKAKAYTAELEEALRQSFAEVDDNKKFSQGIVEINESALKNVTLQNEQLKLENECLKKGSFPLAIRSVLEGVLSSSTFTEMIIGDIFTPSVSYRVTQFEEQMPPGEDGGGGVAMNRANATVPQGLVPKPTNFKVCLEVQVSHLGSMPSVHCLRDPRNAPTDFSLPESRLSSDSNGA